MLNTIDLFAGCGGLTEGFHASGGYRMLAAVEWDVAPAEALCSHLKESRDMPDADSRVLRFDIQRTKELFSGWNDPEYGKGVGLNSVLGGACIDVVIGGPPCQAYSVAGRIRDEHGMKQDYRNWLFESYVRVVSKLRPKAFLFENVPGILSARPGDGKKKIVDDIQRTFSKAGYAVLGDLSFAQIDMQDYGVPQKRTRVMVLGLSKDVFGSRALYMLDDFYRKILPSFKVPRHRTVQDAIGDLPALFPLKKPMPFKGRRLSHSLPETPVNGHISRFHSERDIAVFRMLAEDIASGACRYADSGILKKLYTDLTGRESNIHKYHVLRWNEPSNLIPAHLHKDGLRHIHPDPEQARTITVREAARLQTFPDDYLFKCSQTDAFKMIGNAVPPLFAKVLANALLCLFE